MKINVVLDEKAKMPTKAHADDAGFDLYCREDFSVEVFDSAVVDTGVHMQIPIGWCGLIVSKSGLNVNKDITTTGLIDSGYTGTIKVKLYNHSEIGWDFKAGDKIAQIMILPSPLVYLNQVDELKETERGDNGFGSTGR